MALVEGEPQKLAKMFERNLKETPYSVQIAGSDPEIIRRAVEIINGLGWGRCYRFKLWLPSPKNCK